MHFLEFNNGDKIPTIGLGTWKSGREEVYAAVREAIRIGYRHIDCAAIYMNEAEIGEALSDAMNSGDVNREELWITSKLWNDSHKREHVIPALEKTLRDLQLDYLDLYLIHWPVAFIHGIEYPDKADEFRSLEEIPITETWSGMEECVNERLTRHIGVSNFSVKKIKEFLPNVQIRPEVNQVEMHPYLQQKDMLSYCKQEGIHLTAYSPLGSRDRSDTIKNEKEPKLLEDPTLTDIASKHNCTSAQVLIQWHIQRNTSVIPKSVNPGRIKENFEAAGIELDPDDMDAISQLDRNYRFIDGSFWVWDDNPYTLETLWDE